MTGHIWIAANQGEVGGGEVMLHHIAVALRELGRDVGVVAPAEPAGIADRMTADGFPVERLTGTGRVGYMRALRGWHCGHGDELVWCNGLLPSVALAGRGRRIVHLHQVPSGAAQRAMVAVARRRSLAVVAPSETVAVAVRGVRVLPNWVPGPSRVRAPAEPNAPLRVGFLGRYSREKGFDLYLDAAQALAKDHPGAYTFSAAGAPRFVDEAEARGIAQAIAAAAGTVQDRGWQDAQAYLSEIDVLVVPSVATESFGLVAAEAMASGVVAVVSATGGLLEVVGDDHPFTIPLPDVAELEATLERVRAFPDLADVVERQHERWRARFSPEAGRAAVAALLDDLKI